VTIEKREDPEPLLERVGAFARQHVDGTSSARAHLAARERVRAAFEQTRRESRLSLRRPSGRKIWAAAAVLAAAAVMLFVAGPLGRWRVLTYTTDPGAHMEGSYLRVPDGSASAEVHFSDGSEVRVAPGGELRVGELRRDGARVALQQGTASLRVVHRQRTRWAVDAGPFVVEVTGTSFDVGWSTREEAFDLTLHEGSVIVKGPLTGDGVRLSPGQRLRVRVAAGELRVEASHPLGAGEPAGAHTAALPETPGSEATGERVATSPERSERSGLGPSAVDSLRQSWSKRVSAGDYAAVLAEAQAGGLDSTLAQRPLADLTALSDAARYLARTDIARRVLLAERERFAGSPDAKGAAFLLGRISQDAGDAKSAIAWFTVYLGEAPDGSFAAEALGRKLVAVRKLHGIEQAKPLAREYMGRFPKGAHAAVAREVARAP
jgi:hypothetical protein